MRYFYFLICVALVYHVSSEVTIVQRQPQVLYDKSPKLRIKASGFSSVDDHDILLELNSGYDLKAEKDYTVTKDPDSEGLILKLLANRKWADLTDRTPPIQLVLTSVKFSSNPNKNVMSGDPVILANILPTPSVNENNDVIFMTVSNELRINGTGFVGAKKVDFYFDPPIFKEVDYEDVSKYPLSTNQVVLRLRSNYGWRGENAEPGPLTVMGVDTGGGPVKQGDYGVRVAEVQANLESHDIKVEATADVQYLYNDDPILKIKGSGFNELGTTLRFANGILGKGVNYTTTSITSEVISLKLSLGSNWRRNVDNLPGVLTLLAVSGGDGYVAVGPINAAKGRDVATVFERPKVYSGANVKLYRTHSHELHIRGAGFTSKFFKPQIKFSPDLKRDVDYVINVIDRTDMEITLLDGQAWRSSPGALKVVAVNTRGDADGWVYCDSADGDGVQVAEVVADVDSEKTGGVEVFPMSVKVYQSALQETIQITGSGFQSGMKFDFEPKLVEGVDYDLVVESKNIAKLNLRDNKKWRSDPGFIIAKKVKVGDKSYNLAAPDGIRVAIVLADPSVSAGNDNFHESQSKVIAIFGHGFTNVADTTVTLSPTDKFSYKVLAVLEDTIRIQLKQDNDWLPDFLSLNDKDGSTKVPLKITSINTGAGEIAFNNPITVGNVVKDREGVTCDDTCEFSFDGVCDDGTTSEYYYYYSYYGYYMDDDFGGYYGYYGEQGYYYYYGGYYVYDDYYMPDDGYRVSACVQGTDCTDCGGVDAIVDYSQPLGSDSEYDACVNTCPYARDGVCDDPRGANYCKLGTDCQDCGVVGADNFTRAEDDGWWDDDDDYWTFNDGNFLDQTKGLEANRHRVKVFTQTDSAGPAAMFLVVLEGMVYTVGAIFAAAVLYLGMRWYNGHNLPFMNAFNPETNAFRDFEMAPTKRMPITPDVIRT